MMNKKLKTYHITYRPNSSRCSPRKHEVVAKSKAQALIALVNYTNVYKIDSIERLKDD